MFQFDPIELTHSTIRRCQRLEVSRGLLRLSRSRRECGMDKNEFTVGILFARNFPTSREDSVGASARNLALRYECTCTVVRGSRAGL